MNKSLQIKLKFTTLFFLLMGSLCYSQTDLPPSITAQGRQAFCTGSPINIVTDFTITDNDDTGIAFFFMQISSGYQVNFDRLELTGTHSNIIALWSASEGKLTFNATNSGAEILFTDLERAVKEVVFITSAPNITIEKTFSLSIDDANYLPSTDRFYQFIDNEGVTWSDAKIAAENSTYFGRQGYLATLTSQEESDFAGKQASGAGWIGGSDEETEGEWKWVTGPEAGTIFWRGQVNGSTPNFAFWNISEPNDFRENNSSGEDYAHITDPSIGIRGAWNDLPNEGGLAEYEPKGYIVEYGAPTDSPLNIVASTSIYIPEIITITAATICESGSATISAEPSEGQILWFDAQTGGTEVATGTSFTTQILNEDTIFYATVSVNDCKTLARTPIMVTVLQRPTITNTAGDLICSGTANLNATASAGDVYWYDSLTSTTPLFIGNNYETPVLNATRSYYTEANNANCTSSTRTEVVAVLEATVPKFELLQDTFVLCEDIGSLDLETINPQGNYTYVWKKEGNIIVGDSGTRSVDSSGIYSVSAISEAGCESIEESIRVVDSEKATITKEDVIITNDSDNNSIQVANPNLGNGDYEFGLDDEFGVYKVNGIFQNLSTGMHTLFIRDKGGCGTEKYVFSILAYPKFFTPNNDGQNDFWKIAGFDKTFYITSDILIYNRFGILLFRFNENSEGWNGTYQGKILPSTSYWFKVTLTDINGFSVEKTGSFSLMRK
jgi:gliding motility-associated-like protein